MWRTPEGTRTLQDVEAEIARRGLEAAVQLIEEGIGADDPWEFDVPQFDALTPSQQLALLAEIGRALFYKSVRPPVHTAINEAGVFAIFRTVQALIEFEIDGEERYDPSTRRLLCEFIAALEAGDGVDADEEDEPKFEPDCCDLERWQDEIDCLADRILWDRDFDMDDLMVDCNPEKASFLKSYLGIDEDYYTAIAPDPGDLESIRQTLCRLTRAKPR